MIWVLAASGVLIVVALAIWATFGGSVGRLVALGVLATIVAVIRVLRAWLGRGNGV